MRQGPVAGTGSRKETEGLFRSVLWALEASGIGIWGDGVREGPVGCQEESVQAGGCRVCGCVGRMIRRGVEVQGGWGPGVGVLAGDGLQFCG